MSIITSDTSFCSLSYIFAFSKLESLFEASFDFPELFIDDQVVVESLLFALPDLELI